MKRQNFSATIKLQVLVVLELVAIGAVAGLCLATVSFSIAAKASASPPRSAESVVIKEWGVRVPVLDGSQMTYTITNDSSAMFTLKPSLTAGSSCQLVGFGVNRYPSSSTVATKTTKIGNYQYVVMEGATECQNRSDTNGPAGRLMSQINAQAFLNPVIEPLQR